MHMTTPNRLSPLRFVVAFGVVSMLADFVYEGARAIIGPYLATLGASAGLIGLITGFGEAVAYIARLASGPVSDRTGKHWTLSIAGYAITIISVPLLAVTHTLWPTALLIVSERFGKAVRTPARDTMLAQASSQSGRGMAFALHEALDQFGALFGPLLVALVVATSGFHLAFAVLAIPGILALAVITWLRLSVPRPADYEKRSEQQRRPTQVATMHGFSPTFWRYGAFTAMSMSGFATFAVLAYHLQVHRIIATPLIPVVYATAMGAAGLSALGSGALYDRIGLRGLVIAPIMAAIVPVLAFSNSPGVAWAGSIAWGIATGIHESTMRAAVADLVPVERRGEGYGTFATLYGLAWLIGSVALGTLYDVAPRMAIVYAIGTQIVALIIFIPLLRTRKRDARKVTTP